MSSRWTALLLLALLPGCGPGETPKTPVSEKQEAPALPPAQMRTVLEGLKSEQPGVQYAALETLGRFPTVAQSYREQVERLQQNSQDPRVRQKAAELLASLEE